MLPIDFNVIDQRLKYLEVDLLLAHWFFKLNDIAVNLLDTQVYDLDVKYKWAVLAYLDYVIDLYDNISRLIILRMIRSFD